MTDQTYDSDIRYLIDGKEVDVISEVPTGGYIIRRIYNDGDTGNLEYAPAVFDNPPLPRLHAARVALEGRLEQLNAEAMAAQETLTKYKGQLAEIQHMEGIHEALARIKDVIFCRITHYVVFRAWTQWEIVEAKAGAIPDIDNERYRIQERGTKLISLFGDSDGNLMWRANDYHDGSGNWVEIVPARSREEALAIMQARMDSAPPAKSDAERMVLIATQYGLTVPAAITRAVNESKRRNAQYRADKAKAELAAAEAELAGLPHD